MSESTQQAVDEVRRRLRDIETQLADPKVLADPAAMGRLGKRHSRLRHVVSVADSIDHLTADLQVAEDLADEDPDFGQEADNLRHHLDAASAELTELLAPSDPLDHEDALVEIHSGEGGEESALFAADLLRMYTRYAERVGWKVRELTSELTDLGGYRSVVIAVEGVPSRPAYGYLKHEGGVHRVQRVPVTESAGRIHTSAVGVLVMPDVDETEVDIDPADVRVDVYRSSGPGGQGVNTTDSAVRLTHLPTGIVASCQNERSQLQNKTEAMRMLRAKVAALAAQQVADENDRMRRDQVRTVDRSARVRTYNFPENRLTDHRIGYKSRKLDQILSGDLGEVLDALHADEVKRRMAGPNDSQESS
ncbi:peptide chain release factor 1 [Cutibacterium sp.]|uniref:peptide chain release factor 1 n=1 Tax=Cutibacterium sp. TaxID=1912221 RepID=UPI0026DDC6B6|nr:peptide chain release factor 1 [Cutibacterium sp.]MDO4412039.1 peptide chain release factor 1 [Cutibacterium sp.]